MKRIQLPLVIPGILCTVILISCGDDDTNTGSGNKIDIVGTWKLVSVVGWEPPLEQTLIFKADGTWRVTTTSTSSFKKFTVATGTYKISGNTVSSEGKLFEGGMVVVGFFGARPPDPIPLINVGNSVRTDRGETTAWVETTVKRDGNRLIIYGILISENITMVYEKQ
ncbi:lipocalin family protein [Candidatus Poribacteria bacterium]|nr:lipocalin family protein [Candidatus Poribacteria bacterium]